jgi:tetratricopeptide (TPR) repeat protein
MRVLQARFLGTAMMLVAALVLGVSPGIAQKAGGGNAASSPGKGTPSPTPAPNPPTTPNQTAAGTSQPSRPIWITGTVMMYDGEAPTDSVTIERICSGNSVRAEGYTDSRGRFSLNLGQDSGVFADASTSTVNSTAFSQSGATGASSNGGAGGATPNQDTAYWDCELRARLPGYRSSTVSLAGRRMLDDADVGVIVLYSMVGIQGLTASATSTQAPKDAQKAYERGLGAVKKDKLDQAEREFRKAVQIYPKYADAWLELGKALEKKEKYPEAREACDSALAADAKYVYPYQQLYQIALHEKNWKDVADKTDQLLHLDPYEFPNAYYFNALAHLELKEYDAAETSARQAVDADSKQSNPKTHYLLGAILVHKKAWTGAAASFRAYLKAAPSATDKAYVEKTLGQIDQQIRLVQTASQDSTPQQ